MNAPTGPLKATGKALFKAKRGGAAAERAEILPGLDLGEAPLPLREEHDFYPTVPTDPIVALLKADGRRIARAGRGGPLAGVVWEPACGSGSMVRPIRDWGAPCVATDLIDRGCPDSSVMSFYDTTEALGAAIITNPPFCEVNTIHGGRWLRHTLSLPGWDYLALLLSWDWPAARKNGLGELLDANPWSYHYLLQWKVDFTGGGSPPQRNAWFVWDRTKRARKRPEHRTLKRPPKG